MGERDFSRRSVFCVGCVSGTVKKARSLEKTEGSSADAGVLEDVARKNEICADPTSSLQIGDGKCENLDRRREWFWRPNAGKTDARVVCAKNRRFGRAPARGTGRVRGDEVNAIKIN